MAKRQPARRSRANSDRLGPIRSGEKRFPYEYPENVDFRPTSSIHKYVLEQIYRRAELSQSAISSRTDAWDQTDQTLQAYVDLSQSEKDLLKQNPDAPVSIVVPYTYAALETIMTYLTMAFINQRPIFQYESVSAEDTVPNKLLEILVDRQVDYFKAALPLYVWFRDSLSYGIGAIAPVWRTEMRPVRTTNTVTVQSLAGPTTESVTSVQPKVLFEGTELVSIGPRYLLMDPNSSPHKVQNSEYIGWVEETNIQRILSLEKGQKDVWFNSRYVKEAGYMRSQFSVTDTMDSSVRNDNVLFPITLVHMYIDLIPEDWGLPSGVDNKDGCYPEKWLFTMANDNIIIRAARVDAQHGKFPIAVSAPDFDGYSTYPIGRLEVSSGLQSTLNWLFNSHISNVRKVVNNTLVVDPSLVDINSIAKARHGGIIKLKPNAWGKGLKDAVYQLGVNDVTRGNIADAEVVINLMQRILAATDNMMGVNRRGGERVSATESRNVALASNSRVEKIARLISVQGLSDIAYFMATNTQDYMSQSTTLKTLGSWPKELTDIYQPGTDVHITPENLQVQFDTITRDGSLMLDTTGVTDTWVQIWQALVSQPVIAQQFDMFRIFTHMAQLMGAKNISDFRAKGTVMPDEQVMDQVQKGNMVTPEQLLAAKGKANG